MVWTLKHSVCSTACTFWSMHTVHCTACSTEGAQCWTSTQTMSFKVVQCWAQCWTQWWTQCTSVEYSAKHSALVLNTWKVAQEENWGCVSCYCRQLEATNWVVLLGLLLVVLVLVLLGLVLHSVTALLWEGTEAPLFSLLPPVKTSSCDPKHK